MGMDLKLFPIEHPEVSKDWYVRTVLELWRADEVFDLVRKVKCHLVGPLKSVIIPGREKQKWSRKEDAYGTPLTFAFAGDLAAVRLPKDTHYWTRAAWAYLRALPKDAVVVLCWN